MKNKSFLTISSLVLFLLITSCGSKSITNEEAKSRALEIKEYLSSDSFIVPTKYTLTSNKVQKGTFTSDLDIEPISLNVEETLIYDGENYCFYSGTVSNDNGEVNNTEVWLYGENNLFYTVISIDEKKVYFEVNVEEGKMKETFDKNYGLFGFMIDPTLLSIQSIEQTLVFVDYSLEDFENNNYKEASLKFKSSGKNDFITLLSYKTTLEEDILGMVTKGEIKMDQEITFKNNMLYSSKIVEDSSLDMYYNDEFFGEEKSITKTTAMFKYSAKFVKPDLSGFEKK